jgi:hypothetical protein
MINVYEGASAAAKQHFDEQVGVRRLWSAVLLQALEDWRSSSLGRQSEAERFLFQSQKDFAAVCRSAGLEPGIVASRLDRMKQDAEQRPKLPFWQVI